MYPPDGHVFRGDLVDVRKVAVHPQGDLLFLMNLEEYREDENGNLYGYLHNFHNDSLITAGLQFVKLDENGNHIKTTNIQPIWK